MRLLRPLLPLLALGLAGLLSACGGEAVQTAPAPLRTLSGVADASRQAATGRFELDLSIEADGHRIELSGDGAFDTPNKRTRFSFDLSGLSELTDGLAGASGSALGDPSDWKVDVVQSGYALYLRAPFLTSELPQRVDWVRIDPAVLARARASGLGSLGSLGSSDPRSALDALESVAGPLAVVGRETVRGAETTHYRAALDPSLLAKRLAAGGSPDLVGALQGSLAKLGIASIPFDAWVGDDGLLRRLSFELTAAPGGTVGTATVALRFELFDYGDAVSIDVPLPDDVTDATTLGLTP